MILMEQFTHQWDHVMIVECVTVKVVLLETNVTVVCRDTTISQLVVKVCLSWTDTKELTSRCSTSKFLLLFFK